MARRANGDGDKQWDDTLKQIDNLIASEWYRKAMTHGQLNTSFTKMTKNSEQHRAWMVYFDRLGWMPVVVKEIITHDLDKTWTAPCEWPHQLG